MADKAPKQSEKKSGSEASDQVHCAAAREQLRKQLAADVEAFLSEGGEIEDVPINVRADPPKRPENNYGRGSI